jgi:hypothetical protein
MLQQNIVIYGITDWNIAYCNINMSMLRSRIVSFAGAEAGDAVASKYLEFCKTIKLGGSGEMVLVVGGSYAVKGTVSRDFRLSVFFTNQVSLGH